MRDFKRLSVLVVSLLVSGCGTLISGQTQKITLLTPGANEARCTLDNGIRYTLNTGETITVMRNEKDIVLECYAAGNRYRGLTIQSDGNKWAVGNVVTGVVPGLAYDHFSKGLYEYPEVITVDFVGVPTKGFELPEYHNKDAPNPYDQGIESYGPSTTRLESDKSYIRNDIKKNDGDQSYNPFAENPDLMPTQGSGAPRSKDAITPMPGIAKPQPVVTGTPSVPRGRTADELTRSMNPHVFQGN